jgi:hypothetical protein
MRAWWAALDSNQRRSVPKQELRPRQEVEAGCDRVTCPTMRPPDDYYIWYRRLILRHMLYPSSTCCEARRDRCQRIRVLIRVLESAQRAEIGSI